MYWATLPHHPTVVTVAAVAAVAITKSLYAVHGAHTACRLDMLVKCCALGGVPGLVRVLVLSQPCFFVRGLPPCGVGPGSGLGWFTVFANTKDVCLFVARDIVVHHMS